MAHPEEVSALTRAFSGFGVEEKSLIAILAKWHPHHIHSFRKANRDNFFKEDERQFDRWHDQHIIQLRQEFIRFKDAVVLRTMHPWERDARLFNEALQKGPRLDIIVETACTRSAEELLGAKRAYHSLFDRSIEEEIASNIHAVERKILVALASAYRYEGPHVDEKAAKSEAKILSDAIKAAAGKKKLVEDENIVMVLSTRSKSHIKAVCKYYKEIRGSNLDEDLDSDWILKQTVQCLCTPQAYFSKVLEASLKPDVDEAARDAVTRVILTRADVDIKQINEEYHRKTGADAVTRVILTRADVDIKQINEEYHRKTGATLAQKIGEVANGNYRDFLVALVEKEN